MNEFDYDWISSMEFNRRQDSKRILEGSEYRQIDENTFVRPNMPYDVAKLDEKGNIKI